MKVLLVLMVLMNLASCSMGGFKPPRETEHWTSDEYIQYRDYWDRRNTNMRECGIDPYEGYHKSTKEGLCMEAKGWYYTAGPVCNEFDSVDDPLCVQWRAKKGLPYPSAKEIIR